MRSATLHTYIYSLLQNISASQTKCEARTRDYCFGQEDTASQKNISSEEKLAQVFIIVAVMFVLSWLPIHYMTIVYEIGRLDLILNYLRIISLFTISLGSLVNPIVYSFLKPDFRKSIRHIFHSHRRRFGSNRASAGSSTATSSFKTRADDVHEELGWHTCITQVERVLDVDVTQTLKKNND